MGWLCGLPGTIGQAIVEVLAPRIAEARNGRRWAAVSILFMICSYIDPCQRGKVLMLDRFECLQWMGTRPDGVIVPMSVLRPSRPFGAGLTVLRSGRSFMRQLSPVLSTPEAVPDDGVVPRNLDFRPLDGNRSGATLRRPACARHRRRYGGVTVRRAE